jgi:enamine deaminase RidA (YjgF/YER057c/UK114 family)
VRRISSGSEWEERFGYSRAVVVGPHVHVAGTAPVMANGAEPPADPYGQAKRVLEIIAAALADAGASADQVVRTRVYVTDPGNINEVMRAHGEVFGEAKPACTAVVTQLLDPRWLVEIDVEAFTG